MYGRMIDERAIGERYGALRDQLDERGRRLHAAAEVRALGYGGLAAVARATGLSRGTIGRGLKDLDHAPLPRGRVRRDGGGRHPLSITDPTLLEDLRQLIEPVTLGDPMRPLLWVSKSHKKLAAALRAQGHTISPNTVRKLLHQLGYSRQANRKANDGRQHADRDAQFEHINAQVGAFQADDQPVISVDTKKKELVGNYANGGAEWEPAGEPPRVNVHDFPDPERGKAVPYGVYDVTANTGWVNVGVDADTGAFAVESIRRWWNTVGQPIYPRAGRLLITADSGGSNGARLRLWKTELATLAAETGLEITVLHLPPGTSKWNRIEHRLFSHISMNWRGRPLTSHEVIIETIAATTTKTGLTVRAVLDTGTYPKGIKISDRDMKAFEADHLTRHDFHGDWNYTLTAGTSQHPTPPKKRE